MTKPFMIKCKCGWAETSTGIAADLKHLKEVTANCPTCGKSRIFLCPRCGSKAKMLRIRGNT
jgi:hypothetical protein